MSHTLSKTWQGLVTLCFVPKRLLPACFLAMGMFVGMGLFVVHVSRAVSYLSDAPETCVNCHVMAAAYISWQHSSHARAAACNDCHVPHDSQLAHYAFKVKDGVWHAAVFTMRREPQVIRLSARAVPVVEANCRRCHFEVVEGVSLAARRPQDLHCWDCHREVPHGATRSLSATPGVFQPRLPSAAAADQEPTIVGRPVRPVPPKPE